MSIVQRSIRDKVVQWEKMARELPQLDIPVRHYFCRGLYAREIVIPRSAIVTGQIHKYEQLNILSQGDISVLTEHGIIRIQAPFTIVSPPGTKRIALAHERCTWTTIHATTLTDIDEIESFFIAKDEAEYQRHLALCNEAERTCPISPQPFLAERL